MRFYDALANNESAVKELADEMLKKIAHELTENLKKNITVDWAQRESVRATLRLMVKRGASDRFCCQRRRRGGRRSKQTRQVEVHL